MIEIIKLINELADNPADRYKLALIISDYFKQKSIQNAYSNKNRP